MKKTLALIGVAALLATVLTPFKALSQEGGWPLQAQNASIPAVIPVANSPTNFANPVVFDLGKNKTITPQFNISSKDATSTTNCTFLGAWSVDGSLATADTNNSVTLTACMLAGKPCVTTTNSLTGNSRRYFIIWSESIGANSQITNNGGIIKYDVTVSPY